MSPKKLIKLREKALDIAMCLLPDEDNILGGAVTDEAILKSAEKILNWLICGETISINKFKTQN